MRIDTKRLSRHDERRRRRAYGENDRARESDVTPGGRRDTTAACSRETFFSPGTERGSNRFSRRRESETFDASGRGDGERKTRTSELEQYAYESRTYYLHTFFVTFRATCRRFPYDGFCPRTRDNGGKWVSPVPFYETVCVRAPPRRYFRPTAIITRFVRSPNGETHAVGRGQLSSTSLFGRRRPSSNPLVRFTDDARSARSPRISVRTRREDV